MSKSRNQINMLDTENLGAQLLRDSNMVSYMYNKFGRDPFTSFFARYGITSDEVGLPGITTDKIGESLVRWRIFDNTRQATKIVSLTSSLPETIQANRDYDISFEDGWLQEDATLLLEDAETVLYLSKKGSGLNGYQYSFQYVSNSNSDVLPAAKKALLNYGRYVNYLTNAKQELSTTSQPTQMSNGSYDMFNVTQTSRHEFSASGHALSTNVVAQTMESDGKTVKQQYALQCSDKMVGDHLESVGMNLYFGVTNFDPLARKVMTSKQNSARSEVPMLAGAQQQFRYTERVAEYFINDNIANTAMMLEAQLEAAASYFRSNDMEYVIVTENGGTRILQDVQKYNAQNGGVVYQQQVAPGQVINVGNTYGTFTSLNYKWHVLNMGHTTKPRGFKEETVAYKGATYSKSGFNMYIFPVGKTDDGRMGVRIVTKGKEGINRGLVIGRVKGMTGWGGGQDYDFSKIEDELTRNVLASESNYVSSPTDGEVVLTLSEVSVIIADPDSILWLKPVF